MLKIFYFFLFAISVMISCLACGGNNSQRNNSVKLQQYYVQGEVLYKKYCSNCHQEKGEGLGRLYPPVNQSDFIDGNISNVICIIKYGRSGPLVVNGIEYNMEMKGNPQLTELEVAEIATYLYNSWGRDKGLVDVKMVTEILPECD